MRQRVPLLVPNWVSTFKQRDHMKRFKPSRAVALDIGVDLSIAIAFTAFDLIHNSQFSPTATGAILSRTMLKYAIKAVIRFAIAYMIAATLTRWFHRIKGSPALSTKG